MILPINVSEITGAVFAMMNDDPWLIERRATVERSEVINEDENRTPWIGIYRTGVQYPSRTLGTGAGYRRQNVGLALIVQASHPDSGEKCELELEELLQNVIRVLLNNESLKGTVDVLEEFVVEYQNYGKVGNTYMQTAIVQFVGVQNVRGV